MTTECLGVISDFMKSLSIPYEYQTWKGKIPKTYFVGDYNEVPLNTTEESGESESTFFLDGYSKESSFVLETIKETIRKALPKRATTETGSVVALFYDGANPIRTGDADFKRIQITIKIKEWRN